jgi:RND family efflux transporter MFP subunit
MTANPKVRYPILLATALSFLITACSDNAGQTQSGGFGRNSGQGNIPAVEAVSAIRGTLPLEERVTGRAIARNQTEIYAEVSGPILEVFVENGDVVKAGDPLVRLRDSEFRERYQQAMSGLAIAEAQTRQAKAALELAQSQQNRVASLKDRGLETTANLDTSNSQVTIAHADLDLRMAQENQARSLVDERMLQLENATIKAPISGTVGQRSAEIGQLANTGSRLFVIGDLSEVRVEVLLSERMLGYIREGVSVNVYSDSWGDSVIPSVITRISPFLDTNTMRTQAFIEIDNLEGLLRPGMFVTVDILYGESEESILIPNSALSRHPRTGIEGVYVMGQESELDAGHVLSLDEPEGTGLIANPRPVEFRPVSVVASGRMATAVSGIRAGDVVVTVGQNLLEGGVEEAKPRLLPWEHMMHLQTLQSNDMFKIIDQNRQSLTENKS